jgi:hypothetical protein
MKCAAAFVVRPALGLAMFGATVYVSGAAEPCNPVIDGTYCASQPIRPRSSSSSPLSNTQPFNSVANDLSLDKERPATIGAFVFQGGSRCVALLRRGTCN